MTRERSGSGPRKDRRGQGERPRGGSPARPAHPSAGRPSAGAPSRPSFQRRPEDRGAQERPSRPSFQRRPDDRAPRDRPPDPRAFEDADARLDEPREEAREPDELHDDVKSGRTVYGLHSVTEALSARADTVEHLYVQEGRANARVQQLIDGARAAGVAVRFLERERLRLLCGTTDHQGVVARVGVFAYASLEDLAGVATASGEPLLVLALDGVQDPRNLGAILRSAEAMGAHGVVIPKERAAGVTPVAAKVAAGAAERIPVVRVTNLVRALQALKKSGAWIVGASAEAPELAAKYDFRGATVIVVGGEEKGLRPLVARTCDSVVRIPLSGVTSSLNASIAAAVLVYEARRQRGSAATPS